MLCREHAAEVEAVKIRLSLLCDILSNQIYVERLAGNNSPRKEWWYQVKSKSRRMFTFYIRNYRIIVWLYFSIEHVMFDN